MPGKTFKRVLYGLKLTLTIGLLLTIWLKWKDAQVFVFHLPKPLNYYFVYSCIALLPLNFLLETLKLNTRNTKKISFIKLYQTVWLSHAVGFFTPNKIGEYVGRWWLLGNSAIGISWYGRVAQMGATLMMGSMAFICFPAPIVLELLLLIWTLYSIIYAILLVYPKHFWALISKIIPVRYQFIIDNASLAPISSASLRIQIIAYAILRFFVFSLQYYLLLQACGITAPIPLLYGYILWVYLFRSVFAAFTLADLGIREVAAVSLAQQQGWDINAALAAALGIYVVNQLMPAVIGLILLYKNQRQVMNTQDLNPTQITQPTTNT